MKVIQQSNDSTGFLTPTKTPSKKVVERPCLMEGNVEMQLQIGEWKSVQLSLSRAGMTISDDDSSSYVSFKAETRVSIPMRNLKSDPKFKGCAFQIETGSEIKTFMASSLQDKNAWARKLNVVLGDLRQSGDFDEAENENAGPVTPVLNEKAAVPMAHSVDRQMKQKLAVQQLAQSLQPKRTAARTPAEAMVPNIDRSSEISALQEAIAEREASLQAKERELSEATQKLQREMQYREQITAGVEKWRQDMTRQKDQKLADTRERLDQEAKRVQVLEQEKVKSCETIEAQERKIAAMEQLVEELKQEVEQQRGLQSEIAELRLRLDKEVAFVQILERDTQQMADELVKLSRTHQELMQQHENDTDSYRSQCTELRQQLAAKEDENLQLKEEMAQLRMENKRLQENQNKMHREFFFSLALSIKLSLAAQGIYSNADLNLLYEQILNEPFANWTKQIESKLIGSQMEQPAPRPQQQQAVPSAAKTPQKKGLFGFFN